MTLLGEMWWSSQQAGLIGGVAGSLCGLLGATLGVVIPVFANKGRARSFVYGLIVGMLMLGVLGIGVGVAGLIDRQPYHVWYPGLLIGFILVSVTGGAMPAGILAYRRAESRSVDADLIRGGPASGTKRPNRRANPVLVCVVGLATVGVTSGVTLGAVAVIKPQAGADQASIGPAGASGLAGSAQDSASGGRAARDPRTPADTEATFTLDNGIEVRLLPVSGIDWVGVVAAYDVGFIDDPQGMPQLAHLVEHLRVTGPIGDIPANQRWGELNQIGSANAETQPDFTYYDYLLPRDRLRFAFETEASRLSDLKITQADIEREGPRAASEATSIAASSPEHLHKFALMAATQAWRWGETDVRLATGLEAIPVEAAQAFLDNHYRPTTLTLCVTGDIGGTELREMLEGTLGRVQNPMQPRERAQGWSSMQTQQTVTWDLPAEWVYASYGVPEDRASQVLLTALIGSMVEASRSRHDITRFAASDLDGLGTPLGSSWQWPARRLPLFIGALAEDGADRGKASAELASRMEDWGGMGTAPTVDHELLTKYLSHAWAIGGGGSFIREQGKQLGLQRGIEVGRAQAQVAMQMWLNTYIADRYTTTGMATTGNTVRQMPTRERESRIRATLNPDRRCLTRIVPLQG